MFAVFACSAFLSEYYHNRLKCLYSSLVASSPAAAGRTFTVQTNPISPQLYQLRAGIAQSVKRLATSWTVRGSNPGGGENFRARPERPSDPPRLLYSGYRVFPGGKATGEWC